MPIEVVFAPEAERDLIDLYNFIDDAAGATRAFNYVNRIHALCVSLATFPERGSRRDDIQPGLRVISLDRRVAIAFHIGADAVIIDRVAYGGRDIARL